MRSRIIVALTAVAAFACTLVACGDTATNPAPADTSHTLAVGDSFTYVEHAWDTTGAAVPTNDTLHTVRVLSTGGSFAGMSNVAAILDPGNDLGDTLFISQRGTAAFALYAPEIDVVPGIAFPGMWISYDPAMQSATVYDSTVHGSVSGITANVRMTVNTSYLKDTTILVGAKSFSAHLFDKKTSVVFAMPAYGYQSTTTVTARNAYAPALGYMVWSSLYTHSDEPQSPVPNGTVTRVLTRYSE